MSQLSLFAPKTPAMPEAIVAPLTYTKATHLIHFAAGSPVPESAVEASGRCYWCGQEIVGIGRTVKSLSSTFADACGKQAALPSSANLCAACGWTLSDGIGLPERVATRMLAKAHGGEGRFTCTLEGGGGQYALTLRLNDGRIGIWGRPKKAIEKQWFSMADELKADPKPIPGCELLAVISHEEALKRTAGKFRNFIPYADDAGNWDLHTKAERGEIRERLFNPHPGLWTLSIGDGQKHAAIYGSVSDGRAMVQSVYLEGSGIVEYVPVELKQLLGSVEALVLAGARDEEIYSGNYRGRATMAWRLAQRNHEPTVSIHRGTGSLDLALWLRKSVKDLRGDEDAGTVD